MPRKTTKKVAAPKDDSISNTNIDDTNTDKPTIAHSSADEAEQMTINIDTPSQSDDNVPVVEVGASSDSDGCKAEGGGKSRKTVIDRIDHIIDLVGRNASPNVIKKQLLSIRRTLDGASIKSSKKSRKPNKYNMFMSEQMEKLKDQDLPATEKFKYCIKLWNERKEAEAAAK